MLKRLVLTAALAIPMVAFAQSSAPTTPAPKVEKAQKAERRDLLDTNKDGFISRAEAKARPRLVKNFDQIDTDRDGKLSRQEMAAAKKVRRATKPATQKG